MQNKNFAFANKPEKWLAYKLKKEKEKRMMLAVFLKRPYQDGIILRVSNRNHIMYLFSC